jgi:hypothetical protein
MYHTKIQNSNTDPYSYPLNLDNGDLALDDNEAQGDGDGYSVDVGSNDATSPFSTYGESRDRRDDLFTQASSDPQWKGLLPDFNSDDSSGSQTVQKIDGEIEQLKIPEDKKKELKTKLIAFDLHGDGVGSSLDEVQQQVDLYKSHSYAAVSLAEQLNGSSGAGEPVSEDEITSLENLAQKHGVNLESPENPPTQNMLDFLKEASPDLGEKLDAVKQTAQDRQSFYQGELTKANNQNTANTASHDDPDNTDVSAFQHLYDLKYYQDDKSKALVSAMQDATNSLKPLLQAVYSGSGQTVDVVKPESGSGWQLAYNQAKVADQVTIGTTNIDLFNNTTGELQVSTSSDKENIETVAVKYDNDGDHKWMPAGNGYGEEFKKESYHDGGNTSTLGRVGKDALIGAGTGAAVGALIAGAAFGIAPPHHPPQKGAPAGAIVGGAIGAIAGGAIGLIDSIF